MRFLVIFMMIIFLIFFNDVVFSNFKDVKFLIFFYNVIFSGFYDVKILIFY